MSAAIRYESANGAGAKRERKAVVIDRELKRMHDAGEDISPEALLESARNRKHVLHDFFEWDDSIAAEKYRREQAWRMIQASKFVCFLTEAKGAPKLAEPHKVRALLSVAKGEPFRMRNEALDDTEMRQQIIDRKKAELRAWCKGVVDIEELGALRKLILAKL